MLEKAMFNELNIFLIIVIQKYPSLTSLWKIKSTILQEIIKAKGVSVNIPHSGLRQYVFNKMMCSKIKIPVVHGTEVVSYIEILNFVALYFRITGYLDI